MKTFCFDFGVNKVYHTGESMTEILSRVTLPDSTMGGVYLVEKQEDGTYKTIGEFGSKLFNILCFELRNVKA